MSVVVIEVDETEETARKRHFAQHPEGRDAGNRLVVQLMDPTGHTMSGDQHVSLTPIEARFITEYLIDSNTRKAARRAGYDKKVAAQKGYALLQIPTVKAAIANAVAARDGTDQEEI